MKKALLFICLTFVVSCKNEARQSSVIDSAIYENELLYVAHTQVIGDLDSVMFFTRRLVSINKEKQLSTESLYEISDSLRNAMMLFKNNGVELLNDTSYLSKEWFENNKELAYRSFSESSWKDSISKTAFYEYIFPHKVDTEIVDSWRDSLYAFHQRLIKDNKSLQNLDSLYEYHRKHRKIIVDVDHKNNIYPPLKANYSLLETFKEGDCIAKCRYMIYHLRAAGAPATLDYLKGWGNKTGGNHSEVGLAHKKLQLPKLSSNINDPTRLCTRFNMANKMNDNLYHFKKEDTPQGIYVQYPKTVPKVYRQTWTVQDFPRKIMSKVSSKEICFDLIKPNMLDVTDQYIAVASVTIRKKSLNFKRLAYLSTFSTSGWRPVAYSEFNVLGCASFEKMGPNILYMPGYYSGTFIPSSSPFVIDTLGNKIEYKCQQNKLIDITLLRKYPLFYYTARHSLRFKDACLYGANNADFSDKILLHRMDEFPLGPIEIDLKHDQKFQYVGIESADGKLLPIAEFVCYRDSCGVDVILKDNKNGEFSHLASRARTMDGDLNTYGKKKRVYFDFMMPQDITKVFLSPRSGTNFIIPENEYELFYWNKKWISAGKKTATSYELNYKDVPSGTIYWLRCITGGREERVFTYENDTQIWW